MKQQKQGSLQSNNISTPIKGLVTDYPPILQPKETYTFALNTVIADLQGHSNSLSNEQSNRLFASYTPTIPNSSVNILCPLPNFLNFEFMVILWPSLGSSRGVLINIQYIKIEDTYRFGQWTIDRQLQPGFPPNWVFAQTTTVQVYFQTDPGGEFYIDTHNLDYGHLPCVYNSTYQKYQCTDTEGGFIYDIDHNLTSYFYRVESGNLIMYNIQR